MGLSDDVGWKSSNCQAKRNQFDKWLIANGAKK
jgi:hypothetical protein